VRKNFGPPLLHLVKILKKDEKKYKYWRKNIEKWMEKAQLTAEEKPLTLWKAIRMGGRD